MAVETVKSPHPCWCRGEGWGPGVVTTAQGVDVHLMGGAVVANRSVGVSGQPGDLGAGSCASGDNQNQSGFQFPKEDEDLSGSMHWRP